VHKSLERLWGGGGNNNLGSLPSFETLNKHRFGTACGG